MYVQDTHFAYDHTQNALKKFVVLESLDEGIRFFMDNNPLEPERKKVLDGSGKKAYKIIGYADTAEEAKEKVVTREPERRIMRQNWRDEK